jgi:hypothetical protein
MTGRFALGTGLCLLGLIVCAGRAGASVTIGQLNPATSPSQTCNTIPQDLIQQGVASGNTYTVPGNGTITSWSHNAANAAGQSLTMKIFRKVGIGDPPTYLVVGHDGPRNLRPGGTTGNTFPTSIAVQPGDVLGLSLGGSANTACVYSTPGPSALDRVGTLDDDHAGEFAFGGADRLLNISAVFEPSNAVTVGKTTPNVKKGTAMLDLILPNPGDVTASGNGVNAASASGAVVSKALGAGPTELLIKAKGKKKQTLNATGKVKLNVAITYTPTGGSPNTQSVKVKLKKK